MGDGVDLTGRIVDDLCDPRSVVVRHGEGGMELPVRMLRSRKRSTMAPSKPSSGSNVASCVLSIVPACNDPNKAEIEKGLAVCIRLYCEFLLRMSSKRVMVQPIVRSPLSPCQQCANAAGTECDFQESPIGDASARLVIRQHGAAYRRQDYRQSRARLQRTRTEGLNYCAAGIR